jgi:lysyl-tRNA synthetase class 2
MGQQQTPPHGQDEGRLVAARRQKMERWQNELGIDPWGHRVDGLISLADARSLFDPELHAAHEASVDAGDEPLIDDRPRVTVAGRCVQHRHMGKLAFMVLRDESGDLQISVSRSALSPEAYKVASKLDYGDIVVARGPMGCTKKGEVCVWADGFELHCKSLVPPPEKFHGLTDVELRYRHRYIDMYANPETIETFKARSKLVRSMRTFMDDQGFMEVETPMMQPLAGGAAARPFSTHHNALDMPLFMRVAPELYLKRLLVGGLRKVYEINRNFRNEGIDRRHNPEFTMMEVYQAFGDCDSMLELTESLLRRLAREQAGEGNGETIAFGDLSIDYGKPFARRTYGELLESALGISMRDEAAVRAKAEEFHLADAKTKDHWLLVDELFSSRGEAEIDPSHPTFVIDYPSAISPLTRPNPDDPTVCFRSELFVAGAEICNAYTELNDPDIQLARFSEQLTGGDDEDSTFRCLDEDFIHALRVGMPPAGGLGIGIDRVIMLMTGCESIRDVILFPLLKPGQGTTTQQ